MKVLPFTIPKPKRDALILQEDIQDVFYGTLHRHEEIQISFILEGEGVLLVGDSINSYSSGDVIVIGSNVPHVFRSKEDKTTPAHMISIFFTEASFGIDFFKTEELKSLQSFFRRSENGFKLLKPSERIIGLFYSIQNATRLERFILFMQLLKQLRTAKFRVLSDFQSEKKYNDSEGQRMGAVFQYTMNHFREKITLEAISKIAAMTPNAFCNYFKKRTRKTYITFLNELRIEEACKLLKLQEEIAIAEIAEQSGFQNISNFNRKFKEMKGLKPMEFRKMSAL